MIFGKCCQILVQLKRQTNRWQLRNPWDEVGTFCMFCKEEIAKLLPKNMARIRTGRMTSAIYRIAAGLNKT